MVEQWVGSYRASGRTIYCDQGCCGCCNLAVHAVFPEAVEVAKAVSRPQEEFLNGYMTRLKQFLPEANDLKNYLKFHRKQIVACPFLDSDGSCGIYPARPLSCRSLLSTRPAEWCSVDFSTLQPWDKLAFDSGLDRDVVAWPTQYVAATQEYAHELEMHLLAEMKHKQGWSLKGNFACMVWLEINFGLSQEKWSSLKVKTLLNEQELDNNLPLSNRETRCLLDSHLRVVAPPSTSLRGEIRR